MSKLEMSPEILEALQKLSALLVTDDAFERTLDTVVELSVSTLSGCDSAGVTLRVGGKDRSAAASDDYSIEIDEIQYHANEGPCLTALEQGKRQQIGAVAEESRWPEFRRRAEAAGLRSSLSFPLRLNGTAGALNLYAKSDHAFDDVTREMGEVFARQASIALENAHVYAAARRLGDQLSQALQTRDLIGRAKGILMEREGITDAEAFEMLRTISQNSNVKLNEVARLLVEGRTDARRQVVERRTTGSPVAVVGAVEV